MPARYHPIVDTLWDDEALEGLPFEGKGFFCFLCSNRRLRPSGIYRVTDEQLAVDTGLAVKRVRHYLGVLVTRKRVVRDGAWIFVRGYFGRQPKGERLLLGVKADLDDCSSSRILAAFSEKYPHLRKWSDDRLVKVRRPLVENGSTEQSSTEQYREETPRSTDMTPEGACPTEPRGGLLTQSDAAPSSEDEAADRILAAAMKLPVDEVRRRRAAARIAR